ncbi:substrate-binding and VWA domain-containing protein [Actinophytocola sp. NPDC049390]|uniref:substrate-binding and VWA domain-containing protein n=1 Tax=Actinophytocola sp. NPDC049390 TaxID=3363894 RepID=UPI00379093E7
MGRHSSARPRGRRRTPVAVLAGLLVVALVGWFAVDFLGDRLRAADCAARPSITVTAAQEIAPVVAQLARRAAEDERTCYRVRVIERESAAVVESLVVPDGRRPDVWIPESGMWLWRAQDAGAWTVPATGTSIASSPVVLGVTETVAADLGWPDEQPTWAQVVGPAAGGPAVGFPDPTRDPVGISTLLELSDLVADAPDPATARVAAMRALSRNTVPRQEDLFRRLPGGQAEPLEAFPTSENALLRHNAKPGRIPLVAVYPDDGVPALDFPFVVLPDTPVAQRGAAERFLDRLLTQESADLLADAGFRTPDGAALRDRSGDRRTSGERMTPAPPRGPADVRQVLAAWAGVNRSGRLQVLLDVSGSMAEQVPGTGQTRMAVTVAAAATGLGLFKPTTKLGMWLFATDLDGAKDYRVLLPVRPMSEHLAGGALDAVRAVHALPNRDTALYDAVLAAYRDGVRAWEPGRINTVVVLTDGKDDNASDITLDQLLTELGRLRNLGRPLTLVGIGIGPGVDRAELTAIAEATGGSAFVARNAARIGDVFHEALSLMLCQPPDCLPGVG